VNVGFRWLYELGRYTNVSRLNAMMVFPGALVPIYGPFQEMAGKKFHLYKCKTTC